MEEEKKLYPFKFCGLKDDYSWGSEEFLVADLGYRDSLVKEGWLAGNSLGEVMDTYIDRVVGDNVFTYWGRQFPVCLRRISCKGKMPLRVHPDDEIAQQRWDFLGKEKLWYVLRAGKDARVYLGFRQDTDAGTLYKACLDSSVEDLLNVVAPHAGQYLHIAPGTVHAAAGDIEILEVGESSPLDFCLCGWGETVSEEEFDPALNMVDALDFIDYKAWHHDEEECGCGHHHHHEEEVVSKMIDIRQFCVTKLNLTDPLHIYSEKFESFILYTCVEGEANVQVDVLGQKAFFPIKKGETMLVPAECPDFFLVPSDRNTIVIETTIPPFEEVDPYINPDAPAHLDGEEDGYDCDCDDDECDHDHCDGECHCGHHHE